MSSKFFLKTGDRAPSLTAQAKDATGTPVPFGAGATAKFSMKLRVGGTTLKVNGATATVVDQSLGTLQYDWASADVDAAGTYDGEFEVTKTDGRKLTVPNDGYITIVIVARLT